MTVKQVDTTMGNDKGPCKKCTSEIPLKAQRCPQCGYEPGKPVLGPIGTILGVLLLIGAIFQILIGALALLTLFVGVPITSALAGAAIFVGAGAFQGAIANWIGKFGTHYAAEQPDETAKQEDSKPFKEEMQEAYEQGGERGERWQQYVKRHIDQLSPWVFTSAIIAGIGLLFSTFVIVGGEMEVAGVPTEDLFLIPFMMSIIFLALTVLTDIGRVNRLYNTNHKWWAWVLPSMIPFIGFIPAIAWIWRRRKTEQANQQQSQPVTPTESVN